MNEFELINMLQILNSSFIKHNKIMNELNENIRQYQEKQDEKLNELIKILKE